MAKEDLCPRESKLCDVVVEYLRSCGMLAKQASAFSVELD
jgi:hypothetical protein